MGKPRPDRQDVLRSCVRDSLQFNAKFGAGQDVFDALQRMSTASTRATGSSRQRGRCLANPVGPK